MYIIDNIYIYIIYIYIYIYINICIYIKQCIYRIQWADSCSPCTWANDVRLHIPGTNKPKNAQQDKQLA